MRGMVIVVFAMAGGCASSSATPGPASTMESVRVSGSVGSMTMSTNPIVATHGARVAFPIARVWGALRNAYDSLAIPVATVDAASRTIGNSGLRVRRRLGEVGLSKYINCGNAQGPPSAETYEIQLSVMTQALPDSTGGTGLMTTVEARGRPIALSSEYTLCSSTGTLESRIVALVESQLRR